MNCKHCGNHISEGSKFCSVCGAPVGAQSDAPPLIQKTGCVSDDFPTGDISADMPEKQYSELLPKASPHKVRVGPAGRSIFDWLVLGGIILIYIIICIVMIYTD